MIRKLRANLPGSAWALRRGSPCACTAWARGRSREDQARRAGSPAGKDSGALLTGSGPWSRTRSSEEGATPPVERLACGPAGVGHTGSRVWRAKGRTGTPDRMPATAAVAETAHVSEGDRSRGRRQQVPLCAGSHSLHRERVTRGGSEDSSLSACP